MTHPYSALPPDQFWKSAVSDRSPFDIKGLWRPKFQIKKRARIMTAGSCFAQHISRALVARAYNWIDAEPAPEHMTDAAKRDYQYGVFSCRTGNIYTPKMLHQWLTWATDTKVTPEIFWQKDGRYYDPFRPAVEHNGFASPQELFASRRVTLAALKQAVCNANFFVFTLGLTESWQDKDTGTEFAVCPGTHAGEFDSDKHVFVNHGFQSTYKSLRSAIRLARKLNPRIKFILTVSPVPLTATATPAHVLTASTHSKSVLRAVAGETADGNANVDYFPSYEIITHPAFRGMFFEPNMRNATARGVEFVMDSFFCDQTQAFSRTVQVQGPYGVIREKVIAPDTPRRRKTVNHEQAAEDASDVLLCEEEMLDVFRK